ncbi:hypothetical protein N431DRAFT_412376 [Stipitochalara longipes BDJ]|nr:hypothetical protein N431DRAFT_412376 [Stipitochalara longipes BDJ]
METSKEKKVLSSAQSAALFDLLSHYNVYSEIRDFRIPGSLKHYGPPFQVEEDKPSTSPALQGLVSKFLLNLPGLKDVPEEFWKVQLYDIIEGLERANLSESYDKGVVGTRKTVATAISALIEYPVRGTSGGFSKVQDPDQKYDLTKAEDLSKAFRNLMDASIYGTALDDLVAKTTQTDNLADHEPLIQAAHEFVLVNIASFMHYALILSPKGQYLLKLVGNVNRLVPYVVIRQTLKIGNVATMISAMMKVVLAKMSVSTITNWIGLTSGEDHGMNLMQQIVSTVLHWDNRDLDSRASKIENDKTNSLSKDQLRCLKDYADKSREEQEEIRRQSQQNSISIVISILAFSSLPTDLTEATHTLALEYLNAQLSIRDRRQLIQSLCHSSPDHVTTTIRVAVSAYEPVIRNVHKAVDLSDTISDFESFLGDMLKISRIQDETAVPTVGDFVALLKKHQYSCHKFLHQVCKNGKELTGWYLDWAKQAASHFRRRTNQSDAKVRDAGDLTQPLNDLFSKLSSEQQDRIFPILDQQIKYIDEMHASSHRRLEAVLSSPPSKNPTIAKIIASSANSRASSRSSSPAPSERGSQIPKISSSGPSSDPGPGAYLSRWQDLLDNTPITPLSLSGKVEKASGKNVVKGSTKDVGGETLIEVPSGKTGAEKVRERVSGEGSVSGKPDVKFVVDAMGKDFRALLAARGFYW